MGEIKRFMWDLVYFNMKKLHQSYDRAQTMPASDSLQYLATYGEEMEYYIMKVVQNMPKDLLQGKNTRLKTNTITPTLDFDKYKEMIEHE